MSFKAMAELPQGGGSNIEAIKANMPITFVIDHYFPGTVWEEESGEYITHSPFRQDTNPSFRVYGENLECWIDFAEGGGKQDILDLIARIEGYAGKDKMSQALAKANELLDPLDDWEGPRHAAPKATFDVEAARLYVQNMHDQSATAMAAFLQLRSGELRRADADFLVDRFNLRADDDGLLIPVHDRNYDLVGMKTRRVEHGAPTVTAPGCNFNNVLYGEHLDDDKRRTVVLCEGETDVWSGTHALRNSDEFVFLGLPTGAGSHPKQAYRLAGRRVVLAFDGDPAGRVALAYWIPALLNEGASVYVAPIPEGKDLSTVNGIEAVVRAGLRRQVRLPNTNVSKLNNTYRVPRGKDDVKTISNFVLEIVEALENEDGETSYTVRAIGDHSTMWLHPNDMATGRSMRKWATSYGLDWSGSDADAAGLEALLRFEQYSAPRRRVVHIAGMWQDHFVWPGGSIGPQDVAYRRNPDTPVDEVKVLFDPGADMDTIADQIGRLRNAHMREVTDPILCWLAAAPLRSRLDRFPLLAVMGGSGTGKTTLLEHMVYGFSGSHMMSTLTGTTRFGLLAAMGSTNGFPIWFDEYRPGARNTTIQEFNQLARDLYAGQGSKKSAGGDNWNEVREYATCAPTIVSGEDSFTEVSHLERMIYIHLPKDGKGPLDGLTNRAPSLIGRPYLEFLHEWLKTNEIRVVPEGPDTWNDRQRYNLGVLRLGQQLLDDYLEFLGDGGFGEANLDMVYRANNEASRTNPVIESVNWALGEPALTDYVFRKEGWVYINTPKLVEANDRSRIAILPGGSKTVSSYLVNHHDGEAAKHADRRYIRIPEDQLDLVE